jgi:hypothetical protein
MMQMHGLFFSGSIALIKNPELTCVTITLWENVYLYYTFVHNDVEHMYTV